jgi:hypothetical protein
MRLGVFENQRSAPSGQHAANHVRAYDPLPTGQLEAEKRAEIDRD